MRETDGLKSLRDEASEYEARLSPARRKALGQYFTRRRLGRLLAHIALSESTKNVIDPMSGHGNLLDATWAAAGERNMLLDRIDGMELDKPTFDLCKLRVEEICSLGTGLKTKILLGNSFDPRVIAELPIQSYDLVITNPPYVRYQSLSPRNGHQLDVRATLKKTLELQETPTSVIWKELAAGYSGLSDLSIPAWLLAAHLVRPGGKLALVVPATWRSREYSFAIRYLLLRCFHLDCIIEDTQPGWFSDALVRTHLIVATRKLDGDASQSLSESQKLPVANWVQVAPAAASNDSLVGSSFPVKIPEAAFAKWLRKKKRESRVGIEVRNFDLNDEWKTIKRQAAKTSWLRSLEPIPSVDNLFHVDHADETRTETAVPQLLLPYLDDCDLAEISPLGESVELRVGQGLRTGCNRFFYVTFISGDESSYSKVRASEALGGKTFEAPNEALQPVLRRQSELLQVETGQLLAGRVLDLRNWVLPEDKSTVDRSAGLYETESQERPRVMPRSLADFVRSASLQKLDNRDSNDRIPNLSSVRTNIRLSEKSNKTPRFWYMLPDFKSRHRPLAFVPRINHGTPWTEANHSTSVLIDANFSTFWSDDNGWTSSGLKALLNSVWARACMEAIGTTMGGGALKLEAAHLRQLPIPRFDSVQKNNLNDLGAGLKRDSVAVLEEIDRLVLSHIVLNKQVGGDITKLRVSLVSAIETLRSRRLRIAS